MTSPNQPSAGEMAWRLAQTFCLCTGVLSVILAFSYFVILPRLTAVDVAGVVRTPTEIQQYQAELQASLLSVEEKRRALILPVQDELFRSLVQSKHEGGDLRMVWHLIGQTAQETLQDVEGSIVFSSFTVDNTNTVVIHGDVREAGARSMTILAQFVDRLRKQPWVQELPNPVYQRLEDSNVGPYSPFELHLTLTLP